jgi:hypothetical protein
MPVKINVGNKKLNVKSSGKTAGDLVSAIQESYGLRGGHIRNSSTLETILDDDVISSETEYSFVEYGTYQSVNTFAHQMT